MVICVAPVAEEFFFRGFFYRAPGAATRLSPRPRSTASCSASSTTTSSAPTLLFVPPLAVLGFLFCLVYERTGSIYPVIGMHALNNAIAFGVTVEDPGRRSSSARSCWLAVPWFRVQRAAMA